MLLLSAQLFKMESLTKLPMENAINGQRFAQAPATTPLTHIPKHKYVLEWAKWVAVTKPFYSLIMAQVKGAGNL